MYNVIIRHMMGNLAKFAVNEIRYEDCSHRPQLYGARQRTS